MFTALRTLAIRFLADPAAMRAALTALALSTAILANTNAPIGGGTGV